MKKRTRETKEMPQHTLKIEFLLPMERALVLSVRKLSIRKIMIPRTKQSRNKVMSSFIFRLQNLILS